MIQVIKTFLQDKDNLTLWMNHLLVIYAFLLPISTYGASFIFSLILLLFIFRRNFYEYLTPLFSNRVIQAFILFFLMHIMWLYGTDNFTQAKLATNVVKYSLFPIIFLSFLDFKFSKYILSSFILGMLFSELFSYSLQFHLIPWEYSLFSIPVYKAIIVDDPSPFLNHSHYASSLAFVSVLLIYNVIKVNMSMTKKLLSIFFIFSISINLSLVGGRIGYILYVILILVLILYIYRKKFFTPLLIVLLLVSTFFTLAYNFSPLFNDRVEQSLKTISGFTRGEMDFTTSLGQRVGFWYYAMEVIEENPIVGVGTGDYMTTVRNIIPESENNYIIKHNLEHPHNIYIQLLLQFGVIGLLVFFNLIYQILKQPTKNEYLQFVKIAIVVTFLIALMTETFVARYYLPLFVLIISISIVQKESLIIQNPLYSKKVIKIYLLLLSGAILNAKLHYIITAIKSTLTGA